MSSGPTAFNRFLTRVHRRYVFIHVVEQGLIGLGFGAVAGIILTAILIWRGLPTENVAIFTPLLGLSLGLISGTGSRPTRMQTAAKADQQLQLADLLGSALLVSDRADWAPVIRAQADAICTKLSPSDVVLHRLGVRVWGGAGLASALLVALALIPTAANPSLARQQGGNALVDSAGPELMQSAGLPRPTTVQADPDSAKRSRFGDESRNAKQNQVAAKPGQSDDRQSQGIEAAGGRGTASSEVTDSKHLDLHAGKISGASGQTIADGSGTESPSGRASANSAGRGTANAEAKQPLPPWRSNNWPNQVDRVRSDLKSGHIPDAYRDMLSGYFDAH